MGLGDRLKGLRDQAQHVVEDNKDKVQDLRGQAQHLVADNKDKIQGAAASVGKVADVKTKGRYSSRILKVGEKFNEAVEKLGEDARDPGTYAETTAAEVPEAPEAFHQPRPPEAERPQGDSPSGAQSGEEDVETGQPNQAPPEFQ